MLHRPSLVRRRLKRRVSVAFFISFLGLFARPCRPTALPPCRLAALPPFLPCTVVSPPVSVTAASGSIGIQPNSVRSAVSDPASIQRHTSSTAVTESCCRLQNACPRSYPRARWYCSSSLGFPSDPGFSLPRVLFFPSSKEEEASNE